MSAINTYNTFNEFPYTCKIVRTIESVTSDDKEITLYEGKCDIQPMTTQEIGQLAVESNYYLYFPMSKDDDGEYKLEIKKGDYAYVFMCGQDWEARVINAIPAKLVGKATIYLNREKW